MDASKLVALASLYKVAPAHSRGPGCVVRGIRQMRAVANSANGAPHAAGS